MAGQGLDPGVPLPDDGYPNPVESSFSGDVEEEEPPRPRVAAPGIGKGLMRAPEGVSDGKSSDSDEATDSDRDDSAAWSIGEDDAVVEQRLARGKLVSSTSGIPGPIPRGRIKPTSIAREGHPADFHFPTASVIPPKKTVMDKDWADGVLWEELVSEKGKGTISRELLGLVPPSFTDRAHDHEKGMCVYWKMPKCGFLLEISDFARSLLQELDVAPAQLTGPAWCTVSSFEGIFRQFSDHFGGAQPTLSVFSFFFSVAVVNDDYLSVKKKIGSPLIFDTRLSKIDAWNEGWAYIPDPNRVSSLRGIRGEWRPLKVGGKSVKVVLPSRTSAAEDAVIDKIQKLVES